jgi:pimeloyl-ACP methyl ester carboxylesterase
LLAADQAALTHECRSGWPTRQPLEGYTAVKVHVMDQSDAEPKPLGPPSPCLQALEAVWPIEAAATAMYPPPLSLLPRAERAPVLVLPGFTAGDAATGYMRMLLRHKGLWASAPRLGRNLGPTRQAIEGLRERVVQLATEHQHPVALVGVSLGGVFARALARELPQHVRQVVTIGSPFRKLSTDRTTVEPLWDLLKHLHDGDWRPFDDHEVNRPALQLPAAAIYTRSDGVVPWELCLDDTGEGASNPRAENIEVYATHTGMAHNASVLFAVADRLVRQHEEWRPFEPPAALRGWYPTPTPRPPART